MVEAKPVEEVAASTEEVKSAALVAEETKQEMPKGEAFPEIAPKGTPSPMPKTLKEMFLHGKQLKEEGNFYFKQKDYQGAIKKYSRVRAFLRPMMPSGDGDADNSGLVNMISNQPGASEEEKLTKEETKEAIQI